MVEFCINVVPYVTIMLMAYLIGLILRRAFARHMKVVAFIPIILSCIGSGLGIASTWFVALLGASPLDLPSASALGGICGLAAVGIHQIYRQAIKLDHMHY